MARFVVQPCRLLLHTFVPARGAEPITLDWPKLRELLAPSRDRQALVNLRSLKVGAFAGLLKTQQPGKLTNFVFMNNDRSGRAEWLIRKDPSFEPRLHSVYRMEMVTWDDRVSEIETVVRA